MLKSFYFYFMSYRESGVSLIGSFQSALELTILEYKDYDDEL